MTHEIHQSIAQILNDHQAENIDTIDVREATTLFDHIVLATAKNSRHSKALAQKVIEMVKKNDLYKIQPHIEGLEDGQWVLIDCDLCLVHIMLSDTREHYAIERLWYGLVARAKHNED